MLEYDDRLKDLRALHGLGTKLMTAGYAKWRRGGARLVSCRPFISLVSFNIRSTEGGFDAVAVHAGSVILWSDERSLVETVLKHE